jgi:glycosyltransferase involved in cell wall biosynthesis
MGRLRPEKGVDALLEAALILVRDLPDIDFHLAGEKAWRNPFAAAWERRLAQAGLAQRVRLHGEIEDVPGLVAQAQVHVCPSVSRNESFPNVVLEAKSQGVPSVVFPVAGLPEAVTHGVDGLVCRASTPGALSDAIRSLHAERGRANELGLRARESLAHYDDGRIGAQWRALYMECAATHGRSA